MLTGSSWGQSIAETVLSPITPPEDAADLLIAGYGDDPHVAVVALLKIVRTPKDVNRAPRRKTGPRFQRAERAVRVA